MHQRIDFGRASALPPFALLQQALPRLSRHELEGVIELLIEQIDRMEPDADLERGGDELDGTNAEDEEAPHNWDGTGCPISDPGEDDLEDMCEAGDDGCGPIWRHGAIHWGHSDINVAD